jgi:hypothetical protein
MNVGLKNDDIDSLGPLGQKSVPIGTVRQTRRVGQIICY